MFSKRSSHSPLQDMEMDPAKSKLLHHLMTRSVKDLSPDPVLSELSTQEILDALGILDRVDTTDEISKI